MFEVLISPFNSISIFISTLVGLITKYYEPPTENEKKIVQMNLIVFEIASIEMIVFNLYFLINLVI